MAGFTFSRSLTERIEYIREIQSFLMELENEIHFMGRPLRQALLQYSRNRNTPMAGFSERVYEISGPETVELIRHGRKVLRSIKTSGL